MNIEVAQILDKSTAPDPIQDNMGEGKVTDDLPQPTNKPEERVSGKIEVLIRREQAALVRERQAKEREAALEAKLKAIEEREARVNEFETKKKNPKEALELLGLSYDDITQAHLNDGELPPQIEIKKLRQEVEEYKRLQKSEKDQEKEAALAEAKRHAEAQETKAIDTFKEEINTYITDNSSRYELIRFEGEEQLVYDVIDEHYNRTIDEATGLGKVMLIKEAADKVEEHLEQKEIKRKEVGKVKTLWGAIPKETQDKLAKQEIKKTQPPQRTLTNQLSASAQAPKKPHVMTDEERVQKALAYARGLRP